MTLLDDALLNGGLVRVRFGDAIQHARENLSIDGAPTVTLTLIDPERELVRSAVWQQRSTLTLGDRRYVLVQTDKQAGGVLQLTFEQWEVYVLRQARGYRHAYRDRIDRVTFARSLCRESRIKFHAPEAGPPAPTTEQRGGGSSDGPKAGFDKGAKVSLTSVQRAALTVAIGEAVRLKASKDTILAMVMAGLDESGWDPRKQEISGSQHWGLFQQDPRYYTNPQRGNALQQAHEFLVGGKTWDEATGKPRTDVPEPGSMMALMRGFTGATRTLGDVITVRQGPGLPGSVYDAFRPRAEAILTAFHDPGWTTARTRLLLQDRYEFSRGQPGEPETSWDALGRLAGDIGWRRFMVGDTVWFVSDEWLFATPSLATLAEGDGVVDAITWTLDVGKARDECRVEVGDSWVYSPGVVVSVDGEGPADGRWLLTEWERDLLLPGGSLLLHKPGDTIREPVGDQSSKGFKPARAKPAEGVSFTGPAKGRVVALMTSGAITTDPGSHADSDLRSGRGATVPGRGGSRSATIDDRVYQLLAWLTERYGRINVSSVMSNHYTFVHGTTNPSNHSVGRAFDVNRVAGHQVETSKAHAVSVMFAISRCPEAFRPTEVGGPYLPPGSPTFVPPIGGHFFTDGDHQNHVHVGWSR